MGVSTDAYLVYGMQIPEWDEQHEFDPEEDREYYRFPDCDPDETWDVYDQGEELTKDTPFEFVSHCSGDYPMWIIGFKGHHRAWRGNPKPIGSLDVPGNPQALIDFCKAHNIPAEGEPSWLLCSYWG